MRLAVRARSGGRCEARTLECTGRAQHQHHRRLRSQGGDNTTYNLLDVCRACHDWIHGHPAEAAGRGFILRAGRQADEPEPAQRYCPFWCALDPEHDGVHLDARGVTH